MSDLTISGHFPSDPEEAFILFITDFPEAGVIVEQNDAYLDVLVIDRVCTQQLDTIELGERVSNELFRNELFGDKQSAIRRINEADVNCTRYLDS